MGRKNGQSDYLIIRGREKEKLREKMMQQTKYLKKNLLTAEFETSNNIIGTESKLQMRFAELTKMVAQDLDIRRKKLKDLYDEDKKKQTLLILEIVNK